MSVEQKSLFVIGALLGCIAIFAGAFGSHALKTKLTIERLAVFEIAVRYQMYHALFLIVLALAAAFLSSSWISAAAWVILAGTIVFSGSLYCLVLMNASWWGAITPIGGVLLGIGWFLTAIGGLFSIR